jgi:hypothetical protein
VDPGSGDPCLCITLFECTFTSFFIGKKSKRSHKRVEIKGFFLPFLLNDRRIQEAQKQVDPVDPDWDPDPQHWNELNF